MILADTSVWIDHFRKRDRQLEVLLSQDFLFMHDQVLGELACGNLVDRSQTLMLLQKVRRATILKTDEILAFIEGHRIMGLGLGWSDMHLLASAMLSGLRLWTRDKCLAAAARRLDVHASF